MDKIKEYIQPIDLNKHVDTFHHKIKSEFINSINNIYNDEIKKYDDLMCLIIQLPIVKKIIDENIMLKEKIEIFEKKQSDKPDNSEIVTLEISDKPILNSFLDIEKIPYNENDEDDDDEDEDEDEEEDEDDDEEDDDNNRASRHAVSSRRHRCHCR
jgi:hypothetical protein